MSTTETITKPNVGVYTNPEHKLWVADAQPSLDEVKEGKDLKAGEVTIGIQTTGICGYAQGLFLPAAEVPRLNPPFYPDQTSISGTPAPLAPWW